MQQVDQLNALLHSDLAEVPTEKPLLSGLTKLKVAEIKIESNKNQDGQNLNIKVVTTEPMATTDGKRTVNAGFPIYHTISLKKTEKYNPAENLARFREAVTGSKSGNFAPIEQYLEQEFMAQIKPELSEEYGDKTVIAKFVKRG